MTKRIIVEGHDGAGKSTLIASLLKTYPAHLKSVVGFRHHPEPDYGEWIEDHMDDESWPAVPIHDRFFYSEMVYGPILRGGIALSAADAMLYRYKLEQEAFLIYCTLPYEDLIRTATESAQHEGVVDNFRQIYHAYINEMSTTIPIYKKDGRGLSYNWQETDMKIVNRMVGEYLDS